MGSLEQLSGRVEPGLTEEGWAYMPLRQLGPSLESGGVRPFVLREGALALESGGLGGRPCCVTLDKGPLWASISPSC